MERRRLRCLLIRAIPLHAALSQAINHLLQRFLVMSPTFPVQQLPALRIESFPEPELLPLSLHIMPHLTQFQEAEGPRGRGLFVVIFGKHSAPGENRLH